MRCLKNYSKFERSEIQQVLIALCCHHRCEWSNYVGKDFLLKNNFIPDEFSLLCGLTSWATCGTGRPRDSQKFAKETENTNENPETNENPHVDRYERLELSRKNREEIGRRSKRLLDFGRCLYIQDELKLDTRLAYYVDPEYTLENVVLIAVR